MIAQFDCLSFGMKSLRMPDCYVEYFNAHSDMQIALIAGDRLAATAAQSAAIEPMQELLDIDSSYGNAEGEGPWAKYTAHYTNEAMKLRMNGVTTPELWRLFCQYAYQIEQLFDTGTIPYPPHYNPTPPQRTFHA